MLSLIRGRHSAPPLRVLVLHDCAVAAERMTRELEQGDTKLLSQRVNSEGAFLQALRSFAPDVVLVASALANFNARTALQLVQAHHPTAAVILVTETFDEQSAVGCLRAGAENVVLESNLSRLGPATERAFGNRGADLEGDCGGTGSEYKDRGNAPERGDEAARHRRRPGTGALRGKGRIGSPEPVLWCEHERGRYSEDCSIR